MSAQRILIALTVVNLGLFAYLLSQARPVAAQRPDAVLRGRALELVDDQGRVRASIKMQPPGRHEGKDYPATVAFRLIDGNGRPGIKMTTAENGGAGLLILSDSDQAYIRLDAESQEPVVKVLAKGGKEQLIKP
jgi:hypothetical protein